MKKLITLYIALMAATTMNAQILKVDSGPGRIDDGRVFINQNFKVAQVGSWTGAPAGRWAVAIGKANGANTAVGNGTNTSPNLIVDRTIDASGRSIVSAQGSGSNQFYGLSRWLFVCDAQIDVQVSRLCTGDNAADFTVTVQEIGSYTGQRIYTVRDGVSNLILAQSGTTSSSTYTFSTSTAASYTFEIELLDGNCASGVLSKTEILSAAGCTGGIQLRDEAQPELSAWHAEKIGLYPNPSAGNNYITVEIADDMSGFDMEVLDMNGRVLKTAPVTGRESDLYIGDLQEGVYFIRFKSDKYQGTRRLVID